METIAKKGKGKYGDRTEGILVSKVNVEELSKVARVIMEATYGSEFPELTVWPDVTVGFDQSKPDHLRSQNLVVICSEGVGWEANEYGRINVPVYTDQGFWNSSYVEISTQMIAKFITEETVDLADHIRVFGDRLETNFAVWAQVLTRTEKKA